MKKKSYHKSVVHLTIVFFMMKSCMAEGDNLYLEKYGCIRQIKYSLECRKKDTLTEIPRVPAESAKDISVL